MTPNTFLHPALAHERELAIQRRSRRPRARALRALPVEAAAGASMLVGAVALIALGAPLGA